MYYNPPVISVCVYIYIYICIHTLCKYVRFRLLPVFSRSTSLKEGHRCHEKNAMGKVFGHRARPRLPLGRRRAQQGLGNWEQKAPAGAVNLELDTKCNTLLTIPHIIYIYIYCIHNYICIYCN